MQILKNMIRKPEKPLQQIARRYGEIKTTYSNYNKNTNNDLELVATSLHVKGPLPENCINPQYKVIKSVTFTIKITRNADNCCILKNGDIFEIQNIATCRETRKLMIIGRQLISKKNFFMIPCLSSLLDIYKVKYTRSEKLSLRPLSDIVKKCVKLPHKSGFVVIPFLHTDN